MALVSQSVKNLKGGISQQPDILRYPEQGSQQINGWSSETEGLQKRPPMVFSNTIGNRAYLGNAPLLHMINRDEVEQYYAVFTGTGIKVFDLAGNEKTVKGDVSYAQCATPRDDIRCVTIADYTFVVNRKKVVRYNTGNDHMSFKGTFDPSKSALINVRGGQYGRKLEVIINGTMAASYEIPDGHLPEHVKNTDAQFLVTTLSSQMRTKLDKTRWRITEGAGYILIESLQPDAVITSLITHDGYADQLISPVTHYAQSFSKLPLNAPNGYIVKIVGQAGSSGDAYYVQYDHKEKVWKEVIGWNVSMELLNASMPHALIRQPDGSFQFKELDWSKRKAGDDDTNPWPSFVDSTINDVFFFRNRLGFLSGENIILSRTGKYFNFFPASVASLSDDDPIDVAVSFNRVSILKYAVSFTEELLLWSDQAQFVLTSNGVLSSKSIELNLVTQFDVNDHARPYGIGRNIYFASPRASFTSINRYYAVQDVSAVKNSEDMTAHVPNLIPNGVFSIAGSATENFASVLTSGAPGKIFIYKFLYVNEEQRQRSWSYWDFGDNVEVLAANSIGSEMFVVLRNKYHTFMTKVKFTKDTIDLPEEPYRLHMDSKTTYTIPDSAFDLDRYETYINLRDVYDMDFTSGSVHVVERDGNSFRFEPPDTADGWKDNSVIAIPGDKRGVKVFIGFAIPFTYEFSKFLIKKTAEDGSVSTEDIGRFQLRRAWVNYEHSGAFTVTVENGARAFKYTMAGSRLGSSTLRVGRLNVGTGQFRFSCPGNATQNTVTIFSDNTTPLNLIGCGYEGNYIRRTSGI